MSLDSMRLVGAAERPVNGGISLTRDAPDQVGAVWTATTMSMSAGFIAEFSFLINKSGGADGLAFCVQAEGPNAIGGIGAGYACD
jgi:hypothetical protein